MSYNDKPSLLQRLLGPTILGLGMTTPITLALCPDGVTALLIVAQMATLFLTDVLVTHRRPWRMIRTYYCSPETWLREPVLWLLLLGFSAVLALIVIWIGYENDSVSGVSILNATAVMLVPHALLLATLYHFGAHNAFREVSTTVGQRNKERRQHHEQLQEDAKKRAAEGEQQHADREQEMARKKARATVETYYRRHPLLHKQLPPDLFNAMLNAQIPEGIDTTAIWSVSEEMLRQLTSLQFALQQRQEHVQRQRRQIDKEIAKRRAELQALRRQSHALHEDFLADEIAEQEQLLKQLEQSKHHLDTEHNGTIPALGTGE